MIDGGLMHSGKDHWNKYLNLKLERKVWLGP